MLVAKCGEARVEAAKAERNQVYECPQCKERVILKRGRIVIAHFAHMPNSLCDYGSGETIFHMRAKQLICDELRRRGLKSELEYPVETLPGDNRADIMGWSPNGVPMAFEVQHTSISISEIERRSFAYARVGIAQIWIVLIKDKSFDEEDQSNIIRKYAARPFEKWIHGFNGGEIWIMRENGTFWRGKFEKYLIDVPESTWYESDGCERSEGGYVRISKRWRELDLEGPYNMRNLWIRLWGRSEYEKHIYKWPRSRTIKLEPGKQ